MKRCNTCKYFIPYTTCTKITQPTMGEWGCPEHEDKIPDITFGKPTAEMLDECYTLTKKGEEALEEDYWYKKSEYWHEAWQKAAYENEKLTARIEKIREAME